MKLIKEHAAVDVLPRLGVLEWNDGSGISRPAAAS